MPRTERAPIERLVAVAEGILDASVEVLDAAVRPTVPPGGRLLAIDGPGAGGWLRVTPNGRGPLLAEDDRVLGVLCSALAELGAVVRPLVVSPQRLGEVLERREIAIVYQPIVDLHSGAVLGYEALSRFPAPPQAPPDRWFADAAAVGLGVELEVLAAELAVAPLWALPEGVYVALNVSPEAAGSPQLRAALDGADLSRVVLEITEHDAVPDYGALDGELDVLRRRGARVAVDDTGAGYASLRHVLELGPDLVKLDPSLTVGIDRQSPSPELARALAGFATALDFDVIAEGLESQADVDALRLLGVAQGQGYHLRRPGPLGEADFDALSHTA